MTTTIDAMSLAREERADLADMLATLTPAQWEAPTLCSRWRVHDVVAHMFSFEELSTAGLIGRFLRGGVLPDRVNQVGVDAYADRSGCPARSPTIGCGARWTSPAPPRPSGRRSGYRASR